jgi:hypothetical protein
MYGPLAEVVTSPVENELAAAVERLQHAQHRKKLGQAAMKMGNRLFSHQSGMDTLYKALRGSHGCIPKGHDIRSHGLIESGMPAAPSIVDSERR